MKYNKLSIIVLVDDQFGQKYATLKVSKQKSCNSNSKQKSCNSNSKQKSCNSNKKKNNGIKLP